MPWVGFPQTLFAAALMARVENVGHPVDGTALGVRINRRIMCRNGGRLVNIQSFGKQSPKMVLVGIGSAARNNWIASTLRLFASAADSEIILFRKVLRRQLHSTTKRKVSVFL